MIIIYRLVVSERIPNRILLLVNNVMSHRFRVVTAPKVESVITDIKRSYLNVLFHNKGMDKIDLPRILNNKRVMSAVPKHLSGPPPVVSYTYTQYINEADELSPCLISSSYSLLSISKDLKRSSTILLHTFHCLPLHG